MPKVLFRMATTGAPRVCGVQMLRLLERACPDWDIDIGLGPNDNAGIWNRLFYEAKKRKPDFLIVSHDDISADVDMIRRLPEYNLPVVDCVLPGVREGALWWLNFQLTPKGIYYSDDDPATKKGLRPIYASQLGLTCYRADVVYHEVMVWETENYREGPLKLFGTQDIYMCRKLHAANIPIVCDTDVEVHHQVPIDALAVFQTLRTWANRENGRVNTEYPLPTRMAVDTKDMKLWMPVCGAYKKWQKVMDKPAGLPDDVGELPAQKNFSKNYMAEEKAFPHLKQQRPLIVVRSNKRQAKKVAG